MSIACKIASFVLLIASIIAGFIRGFMSYTFDWVNFFSLIISGILMFFVFFTLGEILERLDNLSANISEVFRYTRDIKQQTSNEPEKERANVAPTFKSPYGRSVRSNNTWVCPKCEHRNPQSARFCQNCGEHP